MASVTVRIGYSEPEGKQCGEEGDAVGKDHSLLKLPMKISVVVGRQVWWQTFRSTIEGRKLVIEITIDVLSRVGRQPLGLAEYRFEPFVKRRSLFLINEIDFDQRSFRQRDGVMESLSCHSQRALGTSCSSPPAVGRRLFPLDYFFFSSRSNTSWAAAS